MLLGDTWWRELQSHTLSFPLACWTSLSSFYWLFWCLAFIICLLYRKWAKNWQGAYEGHVANLHLLIENRHEGNINKSHISLFRGTVLTKQKTKKTANYCGCGHWPLATWHDMHHQASNWLSTAVMSLTSFKSFGFLSFLSCALQDFASTSRESITFHEAAISNENRRIVLRLGEYCAITSHHMIGP